MGTVDDFEAYRISKGLVIGGGGPQNPGMETRIALLEQTARTTAETLAELKADGRVFQTEARSELGSIKQRQHDDFVRLLLLGGGAVLLVMGGLTTIMAKGFHWF